MIIWSGAGLLVPVIFFLSYLFTDTPMDPERHLAVALLVTGMASVVLGIYFGRRSIRIAMDRRGTEPEYTRRQRLVHTVFGNWEVRPAFFFIPMHFWGVIAMGFGFVQIFLG